MRRRLLWAFWLILACASPSAAQSPARHVLILRSYHYGFEPDDAFIRSIRAQLSGLSPTPVDFFDVSLQPAPTVESIGEEAFANYLRSALSGQRLDLVVTVSGPAAAFAQQHQQRLFPSTPVLLTGMDKRFVQEGASVANVAAVAMEGRPRQIVEDILRVLPDTTDIFVVVGHSPLEQFWAEALTRELQPLNERITLVEFHELSFAEMLQRSASLPANSAILYFILSVDAKGFSQTEERTLAELHKVANAPVFGMYTSQIGQGIVGGPLFSVEGLAETSAAVAFRILSGEPAGSIKVPVQTRSETVYDWRELQKWGIGEGRLPTGSVVRFRPSSLWNQYRSYILGGALIVALQSILIAGLVVQRVRRRRTELALRESERGFREIAEKNHDLAGRLLSAQEEERRRIARELHDNLGQQMALLSSGIEQVAMQAVQSPVSAAGSLRQLVEQSSEISNDIRNISHRLHSAKLELLGLAGAVRGHCRDVGALGLEARFSQLGDTGPVGYDVALCLFRIVQEALTNVVKHSGAHEALVTLSGEGAGLLVSIKDSGRGFDETTNARRTGLGITSMHERLRLVGGEITIRSQVGHGTTVTARVPFAPL